MKDKNLYKYNNIIVEPCSYQLVATKKWQPKVILREDRKSEVVEAPLIWNKEFDTKDAADNYAIQQAKMFIERNK